MDSRRLRAGVRPALIACGLAALAALILAPTFVYYDAWYSLIWGRELADGQVPDFEAPGSPTPHPLPVVWAALTEPLGSGVAIAAMQAIAWLSFGAAVVAVYRVTQVAFESRAAGAVAAVVAATSYALLRPSALAAIDVTFAALALWALALELRRPRRGVPVLVLVALAGLLRPEAWLLAGAYWLWLAPGLDARRRLVTAALAASAPLLWALADLAATGNLLHSLEITQEGTEDARRPTGIGNVAGTSSDGLRELLRAPVVLGGFAGAALSLRHARRRAAPALAALGLGLAFFAVLGVASLPLLDRFLILPAALLTVFFGYALTGWRTGGGMLWKAGAAALAVVALAFVPSQLDRLDQLQEGDDVRATAQRELRELVRSEPVRGALAECGGITAPARGVRPELAFNSGRDPGEVELLRDPTPESDLLLLPATVAVAESYGIDGPALETLRELLLPHFSPLARNGSWLLAVRDCSQAATSRPLSTTSEPRASSSRSSTASSMAASTSGSDRSPTSPSTGAIVQPESKRSNTRGSM